MALSLDEIRRFVFKQLAPTIAKVNGMVKRGVIRRVTDGTKVQSVQLSTLDDETPDDVEHLQPFGVSFVPPAGSEVVALAVGGYSDHMVALGASSRAHRPTGAGEGEGGLYTMTGWKVFLDDEGNVFIGADPATGTFFKLALAEKVESELADLWAALHTHKHTGGTVSGLTGTPDGVPLGEAGSVGSSKVKVVE